MNTTNIFKNSFPLTYNAILHCYCTSFYLNCTANLGVLVLGLLLQRGVCEVEQILSVIHKVVWNLAKYGFVV